MTVPSFTRRTPGARNPLPVTTLLMSPTEAIPATSRIAPPLNSAFFPR
ncbi:hypothetical protein [Nonomuraea basaltis]|nr:hypothetical protein [Nonomuraea basaltis]